MGIDQPSDDLAHQLQRLVNRLNRELRTLNAGCGVSNSDAMLLAEVRHAPGIGVSELAAIENIARSVMSERVKNLEAAGLIAVDPTLHRDRRRVGLVITKTGRKVLEVITVRRRKWMAERLISFSPRELQALQVAVASFEPIVGRRAGAVSAIGGKEVMKTPNEGIDRRTVLSLAAIATAAATGAFALSPARPAAQPGKAARDADIPAPTPVVQTASGAVQGLVENGVLSFKGIRYGAPPVGKLRFMPPRPAEPWSGIYDATDFGAPAMQIAGGVTVNTASSADLQMHRVFTTPSDIKIMNEDCLFLNVWTPGTDDKKRPVMLWIHGGGFSYGSGAQPIYQCDGLAKFGDVVTVSVNHRLNVFGYLNLADLMGPDYASSATVGMQDLVLALQWTRDNIAKFGGDPGNVMIMGQSGGGQKVCILLAMDSAKGLFHKASIESGANPTVGRKERATEVAKKLLDELKVAPGDIAALQALPALTIIAAAQKVNVGGAGANGPILDGVAITRDPFLPGAPDGSADVPILVGWCKDEWTIFDADEPWFGSMTEADLQSRVKPFGEAGQALLAAYRKAYPDYSPTYLWIQMIGARVMQGTEFVASAKAAQGHAPAYVWFMKWETPVNGGGLKTPHTMEIPFALYSFDKVRAYVGEGPQPKHMADQIAGAWVAFARTGKPDHPGIPHWPPFNSVDRPVMEFNLTSRVVNDPLSDVRQILASMPPTSMPR